MGILLWKEKKTSGVKGGAGSPSAPSRTPLRPSDSPYMRMLMRSLPQSLRPWRASIDVGKRDVDVTQQTIYWSRFPCR